MSEKPNRVLPWKPAHADKHKKTKQKAVKTEENLLIKLEKPKKIIGSKITLQSKIVTKKVIFHYPSETKDLFISSTEPDSL